MPKNPKKKPQTQQPAPSLYLPPPSAETQIDFSREVYQIKWFAPDNSFKGKTTDLKISGVLGKGAFATVYTAQDGFLNQEVAVKIFDKRLLKDKSKRKEVQNELDLIGRISHPNIVKLLRVSEDPDKLYIVTENWGLDTLDLYCHQGRLARKDFKPVFQQLLDALLYLHSHNIFHRDLKLSNVMIKNGRVCLLDFGLAINSKYVKEYLFCGTPTYMAPEMLQKEGYQGAPIDAWCFGVCLYKSLFDLYPFGSSFL